jgi:lipopolysaccharide/colanic/teichoic acid biosynthesis glycosyltransferase
MTTAPGSLRLAMRSGLRRHGGLYPAVKRGTDILFVALVLLPATASVALILLFLNPVLNPGPLLYRPVRMGRHCRPFRAYKFRTMHGPDGAERRGPDDPIETDRITTLGRILRRARLDELPQVVNVLRGEMSLIGPRPDDIDHARVFVATIPGYRQRHAVRPGISGLAQVELGYVHGHDGTRRKTEVDLRYIREAGPGLDLQIFWRTIRTVIDMKGH